MKKHVFLIFVMAWTFLLSACGGSSGESTGGDASQAVQSNRNGTQAVSVASGAPDGSESGGTSEVIDIKEKLFVGQINDIYLNAEDYLGKTLRYEGIFKEDVYPEYDAVYYYVIRYGPGCCGSDASPGFEVAWDGGYPRQDDWVEAVGVLESYEEEGYEYLRVRLSSLTVLDERGEENVTM
ncbi:MAG: hypothetical protein LBT26_10830 [Clostridiales Family XIII bacterium]|jgi:uncharacterized membrane protein YcgQ (UPF0703/DUF1980 family)|nr:hypothetical protein [Clostridiales Family XIII bacterium]